MNDGAHIRLDSVSKGRKILIVEDDPTERALYAQKLTSSGYTVVSAEDGASGLSQADVHKPDLLLIDVRLPGMSGFDMLRAIRAKSEWGASVPAIYLTNDDGSTDASNAAIQDTMPAYYILKSTTDLSDVVQRIRDVLGD